MPAPVQDGLDQLAAEFGAVDLLRVVAELVDERGSQAAWRAGTQARLTWTRCGC